MSNIADERANTPEYLHWILDLGTYQRAMAISALRILVQAHEGTLRPPATLDITDKAKDEDDNEKTWWGILISPGAAGRADLFDATTLRLTPEVAIAGDALTIRTMPNPAYPGETSANAPQQVYEVTRLNRLGLVLVDAEHELFVMTEAEWSSQV